MNTQDENGRTALMYVTKDGNDKCVMALIIAGADVNAIDSSGQTDLMDAVSGPWDTYVDLMIEAGADVNKQDKNGDTAVMHVAESFHKKHIRKCFKVGAKVNLSNNEGFNAITRFLIKQHTEIRREKEIIISLYAAGETIDEVKVLEAAEATDDDKKPQVPDYLHELSLKHVCRETVRKHLINIYPHQHLFGRIPQLGLPSSLTRYLLYNVSLD